MLREILSGDVERHIEPNAPIVERELADRRDRSRQVVDELDEQVIGDDPIRRVEVLLPFGLEVKLRDRVIGALPNARHETRLRIPKRVRNLVAGCLHQHLHVAAEKRPTEERSRVQKLFVDVSEIELVGEILRVPDRDAKRIRLVVQLVVTVAQSEIHDRLRELVLRQLAEELGEHPTFRMWSAL